MIIERVKESVVILDQLIKISLLRVFYLVYFKWFISSKNLEDIICLKLTYMYYSL